MLAGREENALSGTPSMNEHGKSDRLVVPEKPLNKPAVAGAEVVEGRACVRGTRTAKHAPDTEPDLACQRTWIVCAKRREQIRSSGSPRFCTTSQLTAYRCARRGQPHARSVQIHGQVDW
jgi:hypothetical protein